MRRILPLSALIGVLALLVAPTTASAELIVGFQGVTNNSAVNVASGTAQLSVGINDIGGNQVAFTFRNSGPLPMSITQIYFDDGSLFNIASVVNQPGVDFAQLGTPPDLPGGNTINFNTSAGFLATSNPPTQPNGINPGEELTIIFNLQAGKTYADTIGGLNLALANPGTDMPDGLRIGIHVQGFANGGSESFVNGTSGEPGTHGAVPEPATIVLMTLGAVGLVGSRFRRRKIADA